MIGHLWLALSSPIMSWPITSHSQEPPGFQGALNGFLAANAERTDRANGLISATSRHRSPASSPNLTAS